MPTTKKSSKKTNSKKSAAFSSQPTIARNQFRAIKPRIVTAPTITETMTDTSTLTIVLTFVMLIISLAFFSLQIAFGLAASQTTTSSTPVVLDDGAYANPITFNCRNNFPNNPSDGLDPYTASSVMFDTANGTNIIYKDICTNNGNVEFDCRNLTINNKTASYLIYKNFVCPCGSMLSNACVKLRCSDGIDNDNDGQCDFAGCPISGKTLPADTFCKSANDTAEGPSNFVPTCIQNNWVIGGIIGSPHYTTGRLDEIQIAFNDINNIGYKRSPPTITSQSYYSFNYCGKSLGLNADVNKYNWSIWGTGNANPAYTPTCVKNSFFCGQKSISGTQLLTLKVKNELGQEKLYRITLTCKQAPDYGIAGITIARADNSAIFPPESPISWDASQGLSCGNLGYATSTVTPLP